MMMTINKIKVQENFNMDVWKIIYTTESGYEDEVEVCAVNKFMAWDIFEDIIKDFGEKVISADCFRVIENKE